MAEGLSVGSWSVGLLDSLSRRSEVGQFMPAYDCIRCIAVVQSTTAQ